MAYQRKTVNCWRFYVNYGQGWEHECTEFTREDMRENRDAYRANCQYPVRIKFGRERATPEILADIQSSKERRLRIKLDAAMSSTTATPLAVTIA